MAVRVRTAPMAAELIVPAEREREREGERGRGGGGGGLNIK